jgi:hypothetical protein
MSPVHRGHLLHTEAGSQGTERLLETCFQPRGVPNTRFNKQFQNAPSYAQHYNRFALTNNPASYSTVLWPIPLSFRASEGKVAFSQLTIVQSQYLLMNSYVSSFTTTRELTHAAVVLPRRLTAQILWRLQAQTTLNCLKMPFNEIITKIKRHKFIETLLQSKIKKKRQLHPIHFATVSVFVTLTPNFFHNKLNSSLRKMNFFHFKDYLQGSWDLSTTWSCAGSLAAPAANQTVVEHIADHYTNRNTPGRIVKL